MRLPESILELERHPMSITAPIWPTVDAFLASDQPSEPVFLYAPSALTAEARRFVEGFPGMVTYAVKANPDPTVILSLLGAGVAGFDVASPAEIALVRGLSPLAPLHYHNPVKSRGELRYAYGAGVRVYAVDSLSELRKISETLDAEGVEISVRFRLPVPGGVYDFGTKFGATEDEAVTLMAEAARLGFTASLSFHPGTQCVSPDAYVRYIEAASRIAAASGVPPHRLNVGGGFPANRTGAVAPLSDFFAAIASAHRAAFGENGPALVCEPGRAMAASCMALVTQVKLVRENGSVFLNDGVYGGLGEAPLLGSATAFRVFTAEGELRASETRPAVIFGPTCDSVDRLPGDLPVPVDLEEGDYVVFGGLGAYGTATTTSFNGYGPSRTEILAAL
jgi:ornithine decarboxylase